jgi:ABC-2 type transport system ATP-binding protein
MNGTPGEVKAALPGRVFDILCPAPGPAYQALRKQWAPTHLVLLGDRVHFWTPDGERDAAACVDWLNERALGPASFAAVEPSLEDAFVALLSAGGKTGPGYEVVE